MDAGEFNQIFQYRSPGRGSPTAVVRRIDYNGGTDPVYIGFALQGSAESDPAWYIEKLEYDLDGNYVKSTVSPKHSAWADRASLSYS